MTRLTIVVGAVFAVSLTAAAQSPPRRFGIGTPATPEQIAAVKASYTGQFLEKAFAGID